MHFSQLGKPQNRNCYFINSAGFVDSKENKSMGS